MLESFGWNWRYEAATCCFRDGSYTPSFWLPDSRLWIDVKPNLAEVRTSQMARAQQLSAEYGHAVLLESTGFEQRRGSFVLTPHGRPVEAMLDVRDGEPWLTLKLSEMMRLRREDARRLTLR